MALVSAARMLEKAQKNRYCVGAFNITSINQMIGVLEAAENKKSPLILQTSVTPARFYGPEVIAAACQAAAAKISVPVCLHLDHCVDIEFCQRCADAGYTGIMIDASGYSLEENIRVTQKVAAYCHKKGDISVEGELGTVGGVEDQVAVAEDKAKLCDPGLAVRFIRETGVDLFAPAIGTAHGVYKTAEPRIDFDRLSRVGEFIAGSGLSAPLVVHGGTGLPESYVKRLILAGGAKYNVSTDLKKVWIDSVYSYIDDHRNEFNPGKVDSAARKATASRIAYWIDLLGSAGRA